MLIKKTFLYLIIGLKNKLVLALFALMGAALLHGQIDFKKDLNHDIKAMEQKEGFTPKDSVYIGLITNLAFQLRYYDLDSLRLLSEKIMKLSKAIGYTAGEVDSFILSGFYNADIGNSKKAFENYYKALEKTKASKNYLIEADINSMIATQHLNDGKLAEALRFFLESMEISKKENIEGMLSISYSNIANLYGSLKDYDRAIYYFNESKKIDSTLHEEYYFSQVMANLANTYAEMNELKKATTHIDYSIEFFEKEKIQDWIPLVYASKGNILVKQQKFEEALEWLNKAEKLHENIDDSRGLLELYNFKAEAYLGLKNQLFSENYAQKSYDLSKKINDIDGTKNALKSLYLSSKMKSNFGAALKYHELYQTLTDTISHGQNQKKLSFLMTEFEFKEEKDKLIKENEIALARQNWFILGVLIALGIVLVVVIITRRNSKIKEGLNAQLKAKRDSLEKNQGILKNANRTKAKLFSIIGHDLRSPIGAFQGLLKLFKDNEINQEEFLSFLPKMEGDLEHISFMLNNLLSWGHSQMNGSVTKTEVMDLVSIVAENVDLLSEVAQSKSITLIHQVSEHTHVLADTNHVDIILRNLISNALKFTPAGGTVSVGATENDTSWKIFVRDTGIGMDKDTQEKIFLKTSNHTTYGTANEKGTGLGLNLCMEMVLKNKGKLWVESALNKGSVFCFELPKGEVDYSKQVQKYKNVG